MHWPGSGGPWLGREGLWGAGDGPCCSIAGAGADDPRGLTWGPGPWVVGGISGGEQGQAGLEVPLGQSGRRTFLKQRLFSLQEEGMVLVFYHVHTDTCRYIKPSPEQL